MKKLKCINSREESSLNRIKVGDIYYMDESTRYCDNDGDEYAVIYKDEKKIEVIGNLLLSHFCMLEDGNCMSCDLYDICNK